MIKTTSKLSLALLSLVLTGVLIPLQSFADELSTVCGSTAITAANTANSENSGQIAQYCSDAQAQNKTASAEDTMWKIYAAVAVVCTAACFTSYIPSGPMICMGSGLGAAATDAIMTKNYMSAMTEAMTSASGLLFKSGASAATGAAGDAATTQPKGLVNDKGSCIAAAGAAFSSFMSDQAGQSAKSTEATDLAYAQQLENSVAAGQQAPGQVLSNATSTGNTSAGNTGTSMFTAKTTPTGNALEGAGNCGTGSSNSVSGAIQCAATANPNLASLVGSPGFGAAFQAASGMPLGNFLSGASKPSQAIAQGLGGLSTPSAIGTLQGELAAMETTPMYDTAGSTYAGGGGGSGSGKAGGDDLSSMMSGLLGQMGKKKSDNANGVTGAEFAAQRKLASISAEDRTVSLFARVALRYTVLSPNFVVAQAASIKGSKGATNVSVPGSLKEW